MSESTPPPVPAPALVSRRAFLGRVAAGLGVSAVLAACGGGGGSGGPAPDGADVVEASSCAGYDALSEQDLQLRRALSYVDASPRPEAHCANCRFYRAPEGSPCGGCQLFDGPVSPGGYCTSWAAVAA